MTTKIIIDSTTDLPAEVIAKYDIDLLPLNILLEEKVYQDKLTIDVEEVYEAMREGVYPKTSLPNIVDMYRVFERYAKKGRDFIFYSFSSRMSSTFQTSKMIVDELKENYKELKMEVIDTKGGSFASGLIVWQGAALSKAGYAFEQIVRLSKENVENIEHVFTIDDLKWLVEGGRVSRSGAVIGSALNIKPILDVQDGQIMLIQKVRGRKRSLNTVVDLVVTRLGDFKDQTIGIVHADDFETALLVKEMIAQRLDEANILIEKIGSVLASHLGIGGVGVFFFNQKPKIYIKETI